MFICIYVYYVWSRGPVPLHGAQRLRDAVRREDEARGRDAG